MSKETGNLADPEPDKDFSMRRRKSGLAHFRAFQPTAGNSGWRLPGDEDSRLDPIACVRVTEMESGGAPGTKGQGGKEKQIFPTAQRMVMGEPDPGFAVNHQNIFLLKSRDTFWAGAGRRLVA